MTRAKRPSTRRASSGARCAATCAAALLLCACATFDPDSYATVSIAPAAAARGASTVDYRGIALSSGQILVGERGTATSLLVTLFTQDYFPYGHAGIVVIEEGEPFVYEALATLRPRLRGPPTDALGGRVFRTRLAAFLARQDIAAIYNVPAGVDRARVAAYAVEQFELRTPFDPHFDSSDGSRLYCSELVDRALQAGGAAPTAPSPRTSNASLGSTFGWLEIGAHTFVQPGALVRAENRVALLSRDYSAAQVAAHFEARRELHRRFTADQTLGNLFRWSFGRPVFRTRVAAFVDDATASYLGGAVEPDAQVRVDIQRRAHLAFGPLAAPAVDAALASTP